MTAELLESLERFELATVAYKRVPRDHPSFYLAELGRADSLRRSRIERMVLWSRLLPYSTVLLNQIAAKTPNSPGPLTTLCNKTP